MLVDYIKEKCFSWHASRQTRAPISNSPIKYSSYRFLLESCSTLEQSNDGNDASEHINDDKPVYYVRVDTGKDSETDLPDPKLEKMAVSSKNIRKTIVPALSSRKLGLVVHQ